MKAVLVFVVTICLQAATSPLCLCHAAVEETPSCCHAPAEESPDSCPHCSLAERFAAEMPGKVLLAPDSPGAPDLEPSQATEFGVFFRDRSGSGERSCSDRSPPPKTGNLRVHFQVFLI